MNMETDILIIGGGVTGTGIARDLTLRGFNVILVEKKDLNAGASGGNHGLLHSGARYIHSDPEAAKECQQEQKILKKLAGHCIEETGGLFVAVKGDELNYIQDFPMLCEKSGIEAKAVDPGKALEMEPALSKDIIAAYQVNDASINPFKLSIENMNSAIASGSSCLMHTKIENFKIENKKIIYAVARDETGGKTIKIRAKAYINASGAWAKKVAAMAGITVNMVFSMGSLLVTDKRVTRRVINRLRVPADGDILVPGGVVSILGTTSIRIKEPDRAYPSVDEVDRIIEQGEQMIPALKESRYIRAYSGVRPLVSMGGDGDDRDVSRGFTLLDHEKEGVKNFITITGGKLSTYRLMAEKTSDIACRKLGIRKKCITAITPLPSTIDGEWSEPAVFSEKSNDLETLQDSYLCECEMVPEKAVHRVIDAIKNSGGCPGLESIALRTRIGKGTCQGTYCSSRVISYLCSRDDYRTDNTLKDLKRFLNERWKGEHSLLWDQTLVHSSLKEMIHCGLFCLETEGESY